MLRKVPFLLLSVLAIAIITGYIYALIGTKQTEKLMMNYLQENGYTEDNIYKLEVKHSYLNKILSYNEWVIIVQYADEPGSVYSYTKKDGEIVEAGVSGNVDKADLNHK